MQVVLAQDILFPESNPLHQLLRAFVKAKDPSIDSLKTLHGKSIVQQKAQCCAANAVTPEFFHAKIAEKPQMTCQQLMFLLSSRQRIKVSI